MLVFLPYTSYLVPFPHVLPTSSIGASVLSRPRSAPLVGREGGGDCVRAMSRHCSPVLSSRRSSPIVISLRSCCVRVASVSAACHAGDELSCSFNVPKHQFSSSTY